MLGGTNSLHTNALDETLALPSEQAAEIALRTQQVIMDETGVTNVADPLGGSWYVEALTDEMEAQAEAIFERIRPWASSAAPPGADGTIQHEVGPMTSGILRGIEEGWFMGEIADAAFQYQLALEKGDKKVVGVNTHTDSVSHELEIMRVSHEVETEQVRLLADRKAGRDQAAVEAAVTAWWRCRARRRTWSRRCSTRSAPRRPWARSATRCAPSGGSTGSPRASEGAFRAARR